MNERTKVKAASMIALYAHMSGAESMLPFKISSVGSTPNKYSPVTASNAKANARRLRQQQRLMAKKAKAPEIGSNEGE